MRRAHVVHTVVLTLAGTVALSFVVNVASSDLPASLAPYRWLAWPLLAVFAVVVIVVTLRMERTEAGAATASGDPARSREVLLRKQRKAWIDGVLLDSLYHEARVELKLKTTVDEGHPYGARIAAPGGNTRVLAEWDAAAVFAELEERVVVLGAPGAGKSTTLLDLLHTLLDAADADPGARIPLLLNVSSWRPGTDDKPIRFEDWLAEEAAERYQVRASHVREWLDADRVVLLLDGLDEITDEHQQDCVEAVNEFRTRFPTTALAVCCRTAEYAALRTRLTAYGRVELQPLTAAQVDAFLADNGLTATRALLDADAELRGLVTTPLMLSVLMLAYRDAGGAETSTGDVRARLFTRYVREMLARRRSPVHPPELVVRRLAFIAQHMRQRGRTLFDYDTLANAWLPDLRVVPLRLVWTPLLAALGWWWLALPGAAVGAVTGLMFAFPLGNRLEAWNLDARFGDLSDLFPLRQRVLAGMAEDRDMPFYLPCLGVLGAGTALAVGSASSVAAAVLSGGAAVAATLLTMGVASVFKYDTPEPGGASAGERPTARALAARRAGRRFALAGAVLVFAVTLAMTVWPSGLDTAVRFATLAAVASGLFIGHCLGGGVVVEQRATRRRMRKDDLLDDPIGPVLDLAKDALLLRRLGDGDDHMFVHLLLRDFFAELWSENPMEPRMDRIREVTDGL